MGKGIKTKSTVKDIKALDKSAVAAQRMKEAVIRTKGKADHSLYGEESSPGEYSSERLSAGVGRVSQEAAHQFDRLGRKGVQATGENLSKVKEAVQKRKAAAEQPKKRAEKQAARQAGPSIPRWGGRQAADAVSQPAKAARQEAGGPVKALGRGKGNVKTADQGRKAVKQAASAGKGTIKTAGKSIKTAETTAKAGIKTSRQAAHAAQRTALATARAARAAAHGARMAARTAVVAAKAAVRGTAAAVKAIISATKALVAAIAAGGWIVALVIVVICLIGLVVGSCFGIFFSGEDSGTGQTMQTAVREINADYQESLDEIRASHSYDVLEMSGSRAVWKEVLAVYAVQTTTDPDNAQEVATMDDGKLELLRDIFWQMNEISSSTSTRTETVMETSDDGNGNIVETEVTVTQTYLYITVSHKTAQEMADQLGFDQDQREQLSELLADENNALWSQVLYGITGGDGEIVAVALSQVGNIGGQPYWSWYGFDRRVDWCACFVSWCACFVSWCAEQCGYLEIGVIPRFAGCIQGSNWFKSRGLWQDGSYEPRPGNIIFFDWEGDGLPDLWALWRRWKTAGSTQ